jgi:hypothetical protein
MSHDVSNLTGIEGKYSYLSINENFYLNKESGGMRSLYAMFSNIIISELYGLIRAENINKIIIFFSNHKVIIIYHFQ